MLTTRARETLARLRRTGPRSWRRGRGAGGVQDVDVRDRPDTTADAGQDRPEAVRDRFLGDGSAPMTTDDVTRLDALIDAIGGAAFPATREELIRLAASRGSREAVMVDLRSLPAAGRFGTMEQVMRALGVGAAGQVKVQQIPPHGAGST